LSSTSISGLAVSPLISGIFSGAFCRMIQRQVQSGRRTAELLAPIIKLLSPGTGTDLVVLPTGKLGVLHRQVRRRDWLGRRDRLHRQEGIR
jgi:hypothetical protein